MPTRHASRRSRLDQSVLTQRLNGAVSYDRIARYEKRFFNIPNSQFLSAWIVRPKTNNVEVLPLKKAVTPATATKELRGTKWAEGAIACMDCAGNDLQHAEQHRHIGYFRLPKLRPQVFSLGFLR